MASPLKLTNNAIGRLTAGMSAVDTTATLVSGNGALFPTLGVGEFFPATIIRASDSAREVVKVTARSTDVLTVTRAQEGTSALVFIAGDRVELRLTAGTLSTEIARVEAVADAAQVAADAAQVDADAGVAAAAAAQVDADAAAAAAAAAVKLTGAQTVAGVKTFSDSPIIPDGVAAQNPVSRSQLEATIPAGMVQFFAMSTAPAWWLKADGALVSRTAYSALFAAIGTTFGVGDGSTTFGLPDLRGEFIRGFDDGKGTDGSRVFGSVQASQMQSHTHTFNSNGIGNGNNSNYPLGGSEYSVPTVVTVSATGGTTNSSENRPRNIALLACIKY